jgi:hypothetical protein
MLCSSTILPTVHEQVFMKCSLMLFMNCSWTVDEAPISSWTFCFEQNSSWMFIWIFHELIIPFSYPEPFLRAVRRGALAKSIFRTDIRLANSNSGHCFLTMFLWYPVMDLARAPRRTARKGSGYENVIIHEKFIEFTWWTYHEILMNLYGFMNVHDFAKLC